MKVVLTKAQRHALEVMADCSRWVVAAQHTVKQVSSGHAVGTAIANRLVEMGLAKMRYETPRGFPISADEYCRDHTAVRVYTVTKRGMAAIGWEGEVLR